MDLFAANCTPQTFDYNYRVAENDRSLKVLVPSGENRRIGDGSYNAHQIQQIIEQGKLYGMYDVKELERVPDGKMISILFSRDAPVPAAIIRDVMARNRNDLTAEGAERRRILAIAAARVVNQHDPATSDRASISIDEVEPGTINKEAGKTLKEGYAGPESRVAKELGLNDSRNKRRGR